MAKTPATKCEIQITITNSIRSGLLDQLERFARICFIDCWPMHDYNRDAFLASLEKSLAGKGRLCLALDGKVLGAYAWFELKFNKHEKMRYGEIKFFYVNPKCRERGIGTRVMDECLRFLRKKGADMQPSASAS